MKTTSALSKLRKGIPFTWGKLIRLHEISEYTIVEFCNKHVGIGEYGVTELAFHGYVGEEDTCRAYASLDAALVGCMSYKYDGPNSQAGKFFCKMLDMDVYNGTEDTKNGRR